MLVVNSQAQETAKRQRKSKAGAAATVNMPYTALYSSQFEMGEAEHTSMVLSLYKDFENQDWSKDAWFADTVMVIMADGNIAQGKEQVLETFRKFRESLSKVTFNMRAFMPLKSVDHNENWVAIWGNQAITPADGSGQTEFEFQAVWKINAEKKVAFVRFFEAKVPPAMQ